MRNSYAKWLHAYISPPSYHSMCMGNAGCVKSPSVIVTQCKAEAHSYMHIAYTCIWRCANNLVVVCAGSAVCAPCVIDPVR